MNSMIIISISCTIVIIISSISIIVICLLLLVVVVVVVVISYIYYMLIMIRAVEEAHEDAITCIQWAGERMIATAGEDGFVRSYILDIIHRHMRYSIV